MVRINAAGGALAEVSSGLLAVGLYKGEGIPAWLGEVANVLSEGDFAGKEGETALIHGPNGIASPRLLLVGLGEQSSFTLDTLRRAAATAAKRARSLKLDDAAFVLPVSEGSAARTAAAEAAAEGAALGLYRFHRHKAQRASAGAESHELTVFTLIHEDEQDVSEAAETGVQLADAAILARDLANEPS
ncbi:MAG TPA: M17 family peptidase N-terminal domain-containing protein, partial [Rubrobacter sp.]|nr:M17 family peptidase N-terminal domain-containing protein [Rubrobacter sp.]